MAPGKTVMTMALRYQQRVVHFWIPEACSRNRMNSRFWVDRSIVPKLDQSCGNARFISYPHRRILVRLGLGMAGATLPSLSVEAQ